MFKFNFNLEDAEDIDDLVSGSKIELARGAQYTTGSELETFTEHTLNQLLDSIPNKISYSPLCIPLPSARESVTFIRRDLFDARFQLISGGREEPDSESVDDRHSKTDKRALEFLDNPFDLVPGIYEGGLKTWECSLDLVVYLDSLKDASNYQGLIGKNILELGCGTGIPSLYVLRELLSSLPTSTAEGTELHLQDYNSYTFQLVTMPNLLLTWYTSPHSYPYRMSINDPDLAPLIDPTIPGELTITPELKQSFITSLESSNITIKLFSGSWRTFYPKITLASNLRRYDVLLTSETIYDLSSLPSLVNLMRAACKGGSTVSDTELEKLVTSQLKIDDSSATGQKDDYLCLVAGKVLYFGVGGGMADFLEVVGKAGGNAETVSERKIGVGRKVIRVLW